MHLAYSLRRMDLLRNYADWEDVQKLEISGWIEEVFDSTLNDPESDCQ